MKNNCAVQGILKETTVKNLEKYVLRDVSTANYTTNNKTPEVDLSEINSRCFSHQTNIFLTDKNCHALDSD